MRKQVVSPQGAPHTGFRNASPSAESILMRKSIYSAQWWHLPNIKRAAYFQVFEPTLLLPPSTFQTGLKLLLGRVVSEEEAISYPNTRLENEVQRTVLRQRLLAGNLSKVQKEVLEFYLDGKIPTKTTDLSVAGYSQGLGDVLISLEPVSVLSDMKPDSAYLMSYDGTELANLSIFNEPNGGLIACAQRIRNMGFLNLIVPSAAAPDAEAYLKQKYESTIRLFSDDDTLKKYTSFPIGVPAHFKLCDLDLAISKWIFNLMKGESRVGLVMSISQGDVEAFQKLGDRTWAESQYAYVADYRRSAPFLFPELDYD